MCDHCLSEQADLSHQDNDEFEFNHLANLHFIRPRMGSAKDALAILESSHNAIRVWQMPFLALACTSVATKPI
jgi:hypothetical protein